MQSLVEDVNSAVVAYRQVALRARETNDPEKARFAFDCLRRLLTDEHAIEYSEYVTLDDVKNEFTVVRCGSCKQTTKIKSNVRYQVSDSGYKFVPLMAPAARRQFVTCSNTECGANIFFRKKDLLIQREVKEVQFVPYPPGISNLMSQIYNATKFWIWFDVVWGLAEEKHFSQRQSVSRQEEEGL